MKHTSRKLLARIRAAYEKGDGTIKELAERFGVNYFTLRNRSVKEKWSGGKTDLEQRFDSTFEAAVKQKVENNGRTGGSAGGKATC
jgi:transposase-like protein